MQLSFWIVPKQPETENKIQKPIIWLSSYTVRSITGVNIRTTFIPYLHQWHCFLPNNDSTHLFADDTTLSGSSWNINEIQNNLQLRINSIKKLKKSKCMLIATKHKLKKKKSLFLSIGNTQIENVEVQKLLSIYIDNTLSWTHQVSHVRKNVSWKIALLKPVSYYLTHDMKVMFYNAYIQSIKDYCCPIWGKAKNTQFIIEKSQKRIAGFFLTDQHAKKFRQLSKMCTEFILKIDVLSQLYWSINQKRI